MILRLLPRKWAIVRYFDFKKNQNQIQSSIRGVYSGKIRRRPRRFVKPVYFFGSYALSSFKLGGIYLIEALKMSQIQAFSGWNIPVESLSDSILVFVKHGMPPDLAEIKARGNKVIIDMRDNFVEIDGALNPDFAGRDAADYLLFPNQALVNRFCEIKPTLSRCVVTHGFCDPAISAFFRKRRPVQANQLRCCYFGFHFNFDMMKLIELNDLPKIELIPLTEFNFAECMESLRHFNLHVDYRPKDTDSRYKPLTKILIAAECRSNILIQKSPRVLEILPEDYPYFVIDGDLAGALKRAVETFGTPVWARALAVMDTIRVKHSFSRHMEKFLDMLEELS